MKRWTRALKYHLNSGLTVNYRRWLMKRYRSCRPPKMLRWCLIQNHWKTRKRTLQMSSNHASSDAQRTAGVPAVRIFVLYWGFQNCATQRWSAPFSKIQCTLGFCADQAGRGWGCGKFILLKWTPYSHHEDRAAHVRQAPWRFMLYCRECIPSNPLVDIPAQRTFFPTRQ